MELSFHTDLIKKVVVNLQQHEEAVRIKKLLFCLCHNRWENNQQNLEPVKLSNLVIYALNKYESIESFSVAIYDIIKSINRPKTYSSIASFLIGELGRVYLADARKAILIMDSGLQVSEGEISKQFLSERAMIALNNHTEAIRIKKLVYAVCKKQWQNDVDVIEAYGFDRLILELTQKHKTFAELTQKFQEIIKTINKKEIYTNIYQVILNELIVFYPEDNNLNDAEKSHRPQAGGANHLDSAITNEPEMLFRPSAKHQPPVTQQGALPTRFKSSSPSRQGDFETVFHLRKAQEISASLHALTPPPSPSVNSNANARTSVRNNFTEMRNLAFDDLTTESLNPFNSLANPPTPQETEQPNLYQLEAELAQRSRELAPSLESSSSPQECTIDSPQQSLQCNTGRQIEQIPASVEQAQALGSMDCFELRLELMKYANPLRIKILLLSALFHPFHQLSPDWVLMRDYTLDELLAKLLEQYPQQRFQEILYIAAETLEDSETYRLTAKNIIQTLASCT